MDKIRERKINKAKAYAKAVGFIFDDVSRHRPAIKLVEGNTIKVVTPIFFEVGEDRLIEIYDKITALGICAKIVLKAIVNSYENLTQAEGDEFRNCCFCSSYKAKDLLRFMYDWCVCQIEIQRVNIGPTVTRKSMRNLVYSFGGYRGLKALFTDALTVTLHEFRRVKSVETRIDSAIEAIRYRKDTSNSEKLYAKCVLLKESCEMIDGRIPIKKAHGYAEFNPCMTCANCKADRYGNRRCKTCMIHIDQKMTVGEVNKIYPNAIINEHGVLSSEYIMHNVHDCAYYKERIGCKIKAVKNYSRYDEVAD